MAGEPAAVVAVDKALLRTAEYVYKNAPYDHVCEMGRSVYGVTGKQLVKFMIESTHKKSGLAEVADDAAAIELAEKLMKAGYFHAAAPDQRPNWFVPARPAPEKFVKSSRQMYVWDHKESRTKLWLLLGLLVAVSIGVCLFPVWPMWMKRGLHYILVTFLAFVAVFLVIRGLIFGFMWLFGYELWVLPNVLSDDEDMFKPWVTFQKSDNVVMWHRGLALALLAVCAYWVVTQPTDFDRLVTAQKQFIEDLYSGALLGDATQADRDRMRQDNLDEEIPDLDPSDAPGAAGGTGTAEFNARGEDASGYVHGDYDHLDYEPDVPLDDVEPEGSE